MSNLIFDGVKNIGDCSFELEFSCPSKVPNGVPPKIKFHVNHKCAKNTWPASWFYKKCSNYPEILNVSPSIEKGTFSSGVDQSSFRAALEVKDSKEYKDKSHYCLLVTLTYKIWEHKDLVPVDPLNIRGRLSGKWDLINAELDAGTVPDYSGDVIIKVCCGTCHEERKKESENQECCGKCEVYYP